MPDPNNLTFVDQHISFMCIPKAANTSLKLAVCNAWGIPAAYPKLNHYIADAVARGDLMRSFDKEWIAAQSQHFALSIVRHPQGRLASWIRNKCRIENHVSATRAGIHRDDSLDEIVEKICATTDEDCDQHYRSMSHELKVQGRLVPTFVAQVERLASDWTLFRELVLEWCVRDLGDLPWVNAAPGERIEFSCSQAAAIYARYQDDFDTFGYVPARGPF